MFCARYQGWVLNDVHRPWHNRRQMADRKFEDVQRELDDTVLNLKATTDRELKRPLLQKMRRLLEEADRLLNLKH
jgi:hypothetical protein